MPGQAMLWHDENPMGFRMSFSAFDIFCKLYVQREKQQQNEDVPSLIGSDWAALTLV